METEIEKTTEESINEFTFDKMIRRLRSTFGHVVSNLKTAVLLDPMRSYGNNALCLPDGTTY